MNPLDKIKQEYKVKPTLDERKKVEIVISGQKSENSGVNIQNITIHTSIQPNYDREKLKELLKNSKLSKVIIKMPVAAKQTLVSSQMEKKNEIQEPQPRTKEKEKIAKLPQKIKFVIEDDEEEPLEDEHVDKEQDVQEEQEKPKKHTGRRTEKVQKGVAVLGPESYLKIEGVPIIDRIHQKQPPVNFKVSSYYMNNREFFINFINSLFEPYKRELEDTKSLAAALTSSFKMRLPP
jgi:hypothetical protein